MHQNQHLFATPFVTKTKTVKRIKFVPILAIIFSLPSFSNDSIKYKTNLVGIQSGYGNYRYIDPLESKNVYDGGYIPLNFTWSTYRQKYYDELNFSYARSKLEPSNNKNVNLTDIKANCFLLSYGYYYSIIRLKKNQLYGGAKINGYLALRDVSYTFISPINSTYNYKNGDLFIAFHISFVSKIKLGENLLLANINSSILSFTSNRKYIIDEESSSDLLFFPQFKSFNFSVNYYLKISSDIQLSAGYQFYYYSYPRSLDVLITKGVHSQFLAGIHLKF